MPSSCMAGVVHYHRLRRCNIMPLKQHQQHSAVVLAAPLYDCLIYEPVCDGFLIPACLQLLLHQLHSSLRVHHLRSSQHKTPPFEAVEVTQNHQKQESSPTLQGTRPAGPAVAYVYQLCTCCAWGAVLCCGALCITSQYAVRHNLTPSTSSPPRSRHSRTA